MSALGKKDISLSVIIPTLNGGIWLEKVLLALAGQTRKPDEILVVDSTSTDNTLDVAESYGARTISVERQSFDHGGTRSMAAGKVSGDILVYMTQDAVPVDHEALEKLVAPFANPQVAATYGRQLPHEDATCFARHLRLFNYPERSCTRCWKDRGRYGFKTAFISNSFAAYRRSTLASVSFFEERMLFGEDTFTVAKLLRNGYCVAYTADARVRHSHNYTLKQDLRRYFDIGVTHAERKDMLDTFGAPGGEGRRYVLSELKFLVRNRDYLHLPESIIRNILKYLAYNLGKRYKMLPRTFAASFSMNRRWWLTNS